MILDQLSFQKNSSTVSVKVRGYIALIGLKVIRIFRHSWSSKYVPRREKNMTVGQPRRINCSIDTSNHGRSKHLKNINNNYIECIIYVLVMFWLIDFTWNSSSISTMLYRKNTIYYRGGGSKVKLTLHEAASGMHPEWQGGLLKLPPPL